MPKVLIVEDMEHWFDRINEQLEEKAEVLWGATLDEADELFQNNPDIDIIIMDTCVPGDSPNSMPLVKKIIGAGFQKPIIACSSMPLYTRKLVEAGATHQSDKYKVAEMALKLLNL